MCKIDLGAGSAGSRASSSAPHQPPGVSGRDFNFGRPGRHRYTPNALPRGPDVFVAQSSGSRHRLRGSHCGRTRFHTHHFNHQADHPAFLAERPSSRDFHFGRPNQNLIHPPALRTARFLRRTFFQLPIPVGSGCVDAGTDWSPCFQGIPQTPLHTCGLSSPGGLRWTRRASACRDR